MASRVPPMAPLAGLLAATSLLAGCGLSVESSAPAPSGTLAGVGRLPTATVPAVTFPADLSVDFTLPALEVTASGAVAEGNRLLMIGDSIFTGISRRYTNEACDQLVPLGWQVLVEEEPSRAVDFGPKVLDKRLGEGWDVVAIELGTNYGGDEEAYRRTLEGMIADIGAKPIVLLNTTEYRLLQREVNQVIAEVAAAHPNVTVVDWRTISDQDGVLTGDGVHPTPAGQVVMVAAMAQVLGEAPTMPGACIGGQAFTDDSKAGAGALPPTTIRPRSSGTGTTAPPRGSGTTTPPTEAPTPEPEPDPEPQPKPEPTSPPATQAEAGAGG